jgi:general secretion pathway protein G
MIFTQNVKGWQLMAPNIVIGNRFSKGFTLIELMVVMTITALLLSIAYPRYISHIEKSKEAALLQDLSVMRVAIDQFHADLGRYPLELNELVEKKYIRHIPKDPITESNDTWQLILADDENGIENVKSGAEGNASDGSPYIEW